MSSSRNRKIGTTNGFAVSVTSDPQSLVVRSFGHDLAQPDCDFVGEQPTLGRQSDGVFRDNNERVKKIDIGI
jgi:hypothetical protein